MKRSQLILFLCFLTFIVACDRALQQEFCVLDLTLETGSYAYCAADRISDVSYFAVPHFTEPNIDSLFSVTSDSLVLSQQTTLEYGAYLLTAKQHYLFAKLNGQNKVWICTKPKLASEQLQFLRSLMNYDYASFKSKTPFILVYPFEDTSKAIGVTAGNILAINLDMATFKSLDRIGGRLEGCRMDRSANCFRCSIDLGFGEEVAFDENGNEL